jgi:hypothetical protein
MLLASILSILEQKQFVQVQPKFAEKTDAEPFSLKINTIPEAYLAQSRRAPPSQQALERGLVSPSVPAPGSPSTSIYDLIQAIAKFEKEPKRVVDVFE